VKAAEGKGRKKKGPIRNLERKEFSTPGEGKGLRKLLPRSSVSKIRCRKEKKGRTSGGREPTRPERSKKTKEGREKS